MMVVGSLSEEERRPEHTEKAAIYKTGRWLSLGTEGASTLILDFLASKL